MRRLPACVVALLLAMATLATAQTRLRATSAAAFLKEPGGLRIGSLISGVTYSTGRTNNGHVETTIEGWIPAASAEGTTRDGFDLTVIAGSGEAVRAAPGGSMVARVQEGTLLSKVGTRGTWVRVRRAGWVPRGSLVAAAEVVAAKPPDPKPEPPRVSPPPPPPPQPTPASPKPAGVVTPPPPPPPPPAPAPRQGSSRDSVAKPDAPKGVIVSDRATVHRGSEVVVTPQGGRIASFGESADVLVVERRPGWVKIQVEGWVREGDVAADVSSGPRITGAMLRERPDKYNGESVTWRIQYLAVQEADELRSEMPRGQPYILARGPLPESGFVYLMVTKEQAAEFKARAPLDEVMIEATIRTGRSRYLPTPVLSLVNVMR